MLLALDQGGTKTAAVLCDDAGKIIGVGYGFGACHFSAGLKKAMEAVEMAAGNALKDAGICRNEITEVMAGLAGANWPDEIEMLQNALKEKFSVEKATVYNDCVVALRAGSDAPDAMVLCGGTGLNCALRRKGEIVKVYNNYVGEREQGGGALGGRAIEAILESEIAIRPKTVLREMAFEFFGLKDITSLMLGYQRHQLNKPTKEFVFPLFEAAEAGDTVANDVIREFGESLAKFIASASRLYGFAGEPLEVVLSGGLFKAKYPLLKDTILREGLGYYANCKLVEARFEPVVGAAVMGLEAMGRGDTVPNCRTSAEALGLLRK